MFKKLLLIGIIACSITPNAHADENKYPPPPIAYAPLIAITPLPFYKAPNGSLFLNEKEKLNYLKYYIELENDKKNHLIKAIFNSIDKHQTIYDAFHIKYKIKYSSQCPIDFEGNLSLDPNICHDTYQQYLKKDKIYRDLHKFERKLNSFPDNSKEYNDFLHTKYKNFDELYHDIQTIKPTFWHDTAYYIPDNKIYIINNNNDISIDNSLKDSIEIQPLYVININTNKICISKNDFLQNKQAKKIYKKISFNNNGKIEPLSIVNKLNSNDFLIQYKNMYIKMPAINCANSIEVWGDIKVWSGK